MNFTSRQRTRNSQKNGFIALISAIIISIILLGLATTLGTSALYARFDALGSEYKRVSLGLAESCINTALLKAAQTYGYAGNEIIPVGSGTCTIKPLAYVDDPAHHRKLVTISTQGQYQNSFSNVVVSAYVQDPTATVVTLPPTCTLIASPTSFPAGKPMTLLWSASSNATGMSIDHGIGAVTPVLSGTYGPFTPAGGAGTQTYTATVGNAGGNNICAAYVTLTPPPAAPSCADSVMIFDRTGSMSGGDLSNEKASGNGLVTLYAGVTPPLPQIGAGSFGGLDGSAAQVPLLGQLTTTYSHITSALNSITGSNSSVGSDLSAAINVGAAELNSARHVSGKKKVLILVSDGVPNEPDTIAGDTGFLSPTASVQNAAGDAWITPTNAYASGSGDASDIANASNRERYYNFNFPAIPGGSTINGIEANVTSWVTAGSGSATSPLLAPSSAGAYDQWTANTGSDVSATLANDGDTSYIDTSVSVDTFQMAGASIPAGSTINSVTLTAVAKGTASGAQFQLVSEKGGTLSIGPTNTLSTSYASYTRTFSTDPATGNPWTLAEVNAWTTRFGVRTTNAATVPRVTQVYITVSYAPAGSTAMLSPSANASDTGGNGNGFENNPAGAYADGGSVALNSNNGGDRHRYYNYGISLPAGAVVTGIQARPDWYLDNTSGTNSVDLELSWNGGTSWTAKKNESTETTNDTNNKIVGSSADTWGRAWSATNDFTNTNFRVRITMNSSSGSRDFSLDWLPVQIFYSLPSVSTGALVPVSAGTFDQWTANTGSDVSATLANDGDTSYIDTSVSVDTFQMAGAGVPAGSTINSVTLTAVAKGTASGAQFQLVSEKGGTLSIGPTNTLSTSYTSYTRTFSTDPATGNPWTLAEVNAWTTRFGVRTTNAATLPRVTQVQVTVAYTPPPATACQLGVDLSWNAGASWTSEKAQTLSAVSNTYMLGGSSDTWNGHTWGVGDFTNSNFRVRVHAIDPGSACDNTAVDHLDWLQMRILYTKPADPFGAATAAASSAQSLGGIDNLPVTIFTIHFGDTSGEPFLSSLSTQNVVSLPVSSISRSGNVVTVTIGGLSGFSVGQQVVIAGVSNNSYNGTFVITGVTTTTFTYAQNGSNGSSSGGTATVNKSFFVSPTSAQMAGIFQAIGYQVCPAAAPECSNTIDDDGDGLIDNLDPNCHTDGNAGNAASYDPTINDEWGTSVLPPPPPPPPPPPNITVSSWQQAP